MLKKTLLLFTAAACIIALSPHGLTRAAEPASPLELYRQALATMSDLKQPAFVTYKLESKSEGLKADLSATCLPCITPGNSVNRWTLRHRTSDFVTEIVDSANGRRYVSHSPNSDPTWYGAYRALRLGMISMVGAYRVPPLPPSPAPTPNAPVATPDTTFKTIAAITVLGPGIYNVEDRGSTTCSNGDPGHALHLWSRARDPRHQLTDVVIDLRSMRFCMVRMALNGPGALGGNGVWEEHFDNVGGYWMVTDGSVEGTLRFFGIKAMHGIWRYRLLDMQFPDSLSPDVFSTPAPAKPPSNQKR